MGSNGSSAACLVCANIFVQDAIEDPSRLGEGNGLAQAFIAGGRILGPTLAGALFSLGDACCHSRGVFLCFTAIAAFAVANATSVKFLNSPSRAQRPLLSDKGTQGSQKAYEAVSCEAHGMLVGAEQSEEGQQQRRQEWGQAIRVLPYQALEHL